MDNARGGCRFVAGVNCPCARLLFASREKRTQTKQMIDRANECVHAAVFDTDTTQVFHRLVFAKIDEFTLNLRADDDSFSCEMVPRIILHRANMRGRAGAGGADRGLAGLKRSITAEISVRGCN
jgi:hypothetical protein